MRQKLDWTIVIWQTFYSDSIVDERERERERFVSERTVSGWVNTSKKLSVCDEKGLQTHQLVKSR